ncbi:MAG: phage tail sheath C-terminal domain-containing protein [Bacteroidota bacterium]
MDAAVNLVDSLNTSTNSLKATSESLRGRFKILLEGFSKDLDIFNQSLRDTTTPHPFPGFFEAAIPATNSLRLLYQLLENLLLEASKALAVSGTAALNLEEIFQTQKLKTQLSRLKTHHERIKTLSAAQTSPDFGLGLELFPNDTSSNFLAAIGVIDPAYTSLADIPEDAATRSEYDDLYNSTIDVANNISIYGSLVAAAMRQANTASSAAAARIAGKESMDKITKSDIESSLRALIATQTSTDLTPVLRNEASGSLNTILADSTATNEDVGLAAIVHAISAQLAIAQPTLELGDSSTSPVIEQVEPYINQAIEFSRILALRVENSVAGNKAYTILDISWTLTETWVSMAKDAIQASYADFIDAFGSLIEAGKSAEELYEATLENSFGKYKSLKQKIASESSILPPSGAIAGVYANVDSNRGVFKAPANISLNTVIAPSTLINRDIQEDLNVDANAGKSVNAIRAFAGKGTLVWGARTLAGNDNEWRYVNVRRYFNFAEESIKKATEAFVFEPNDANTWAKIKGMITNFLTNQWRDGALQGAKPPQAFFVKVGLGETMTAQDVLEGRMIVEIGLAVVRPAEFIILRFSHKMPEA